MRSKTDLKVLHFQIDVNLNSSNWNWDEPRVDESISFSLPLPLFDEKGIAKLISEVVETTKRKFPEAERALAERKAKEEAEKEAEKATVS